MTTTTAVDAVVEGIDRVLDQAAVDDARDAMQILDILRPTTPSPSATITVPLATVRWVDGTEVTVVEARVQVTVDPAQVEAALWATEQGLGQPSGLISYQVRRVVVDAAAPGELAALARAAE